ncbi:hypothetical protein DTO006G1_583 [Penicillium roqueforti]|nr:hypothetical protein CBS147337_429 [Penicillium roqueforti]KAI2764165.1 hypothetical protein DTO006G1_583 [Penicillium roqueforti]KAI3259480.1 hypothetical protein DTO006G7_371 [Penicillium roqueforti]
MALSACNAVSNPSFETGILAPWHPSAVNVAQVSNGTIAYSGDYYLNLQTAVGNRGSTISQGLRHLKPHTEYKFSAQAQVPSPSGSEYCSVYVYVGRNATVGSIASVQLFNFGEWTEVTGSYVPKRENEILSIGAACDSEDSSYTDNVLFDDISFIPNDCAYGLA